MNVHRMGAFVCISIVGTLAFIQLGDGDDGNGENVVEQNTRVQREVRGAAEADSIIFSSDANVAARSGKRSKHSAASTQESIAKAHDFVKTASREVITQRVPTQVVGDGSDTNKPPPGTIDYAALYEDPINWRNTYIITLKRDALRVEHVTNLTRDIWPGSNIWWAIDGKQISDATITKWREEGYLAKRLAGFMNPKSKIGKPKISCLMSHVRVWEQLAKEEDPNAFYFILEDDVYATDGFNEHYTGVIKDLKGLSWDWVYLAIHPTFKRLNKLVLDGKQYINQAPRMVGNAGYLLSRQGARNLLKHVLPCSLPKDQAIRVLVVNRTIDAYIVKKELVGVLGQQGQGFVGSLKKDPLRKFKSNIWDK